MDELRRELCEYGRRAVSLGLVIGTSGNLSVRHGDLVAVTPSGVALDRLRPEDCPVLDLDGRVVEDAAAVRDASQARDGHTEQAHDSHTDHVRDGDTPQAHGTPQARGAGHPGGSADTAGARGGRKPSSETPMHLALYAATGARAIVHTHSVFATVVASTMTELPPIHYNALLLGGTVRVAPYATYGTPELAANVVEALAGGQAALMANHGGVTIGGSLEQAFEATRLLEWLCEVYVRALGVGRPAVLTDDQLAAVVERAFSG
ncbi:class II aldolase/adducin family protein [Microbispora sp. NPDC049125]|uniref:class II aldolase/adducin family protein n=1 Tax=Microbispora sp. NPDC049125 TaxID=3154929 RepID=UPI003466FB95